MNDLQPDTRGRFVLGTAVADAIYSPGCRAWGWFVYASVNPPDVAALKNLMDVHTALKAYGYEHELDSLDGFRPLSDFIGIRIPEKLADEISIDSEVRGLRG